jgi:glycosyltransferase involved in cell wall biosynthesis
MERIELRCARGATALTTVSDGLAGMLESRFGRRPTVIRNCHDLRLDQPADPDLRQTLGLPESAFLVVSIGNAKFGMVFDEALEAVSRLPEEVHLAFVGAGFVPYADRVRERELSSRVHLLPPVPPTQISSFIGSADLAALLYREADRNFVNALPNRFFHAIAAGLPLLYPPLPEISALASRHQLGIEVDTANPDAIARTLRGLSADRELLGPYAASAARARGELSWEHEESMVADVVGAAIEDPRLSSRPS